MEWIFNKYFGKLAFYANELLNNDKEKARDTATNVFVYIWEQRSRLEFKNEELLQGYLYAITRNKTVDVIGEEKDRALILCEAIAFIREEVNHLSPQQKAVVELLLAGKLTSFPSISPPRSTD